MNGNAQKFIKFLLKLKVFPYFEEKKEKSSKELEGGGKMLKVWLLDNTRKAAINVDLNHLLFDIVGGQHSNLTRAFNASSHPSAID